MSGLTFTNFKILLCILVFGSDFGQSTFGSIPDGSVFGHCPKSERFCLDFGHFWTSEIQVNAQNRPKNVRFST